MNHGVYLKERTPIAILIGIVLVIPSFIPAAIVAVLYMFLAGRYITGSWIPYADEIALQWFPEMVRGLVIGACTVWLTAFICRKLSWGFVIETVRYSIMAFWAAIALIIIVFSISMRGVTLDLLGMAALLLGFGFGLWSNDGPD